ncbi:MAG: LamG-like jellyroll fold domain-containing protein [bacterium]
MKKTFFFFLALSLFYSASNVLADSTVSFISPTPENGSTSTPTSLAISATSTMSGQHYILNNFDNSLVGWWRGESTTTDESGYGNNGTLNSFTYSKVNTAGATTTASDTYQAWAAFAGPSKAFDGSTESFWFCGSDTADGKTQWLKIDLGAGNEVAVTKTRMYYSSPTVSMTGKIQGSNDDSIWTDLTTYSHGSSMVWYNDVFSNSQTYRYYRLFISSGNPSNYWPEIRELELYTRTSSNTYPAGKFGQAFNFDGQADYIDMGNSNSLKITNNITMSAWVKPAESGSGWKTIITNQWDYARQSGILVSMSGSTGRVHVALSNGTGIDSVDGQTSINDGSWHLVTVTFTSGEVKIYVDGLIDTDYNSSFTSIAYNSNNLTIGKNSEASYEYWTGLIDEVMIFSRTLAAQEIKSLFNAVLSGYQYSNTFVGLISGNHIAKVYAVDTSANKVSSPERTLAVSSVFANDGVAGIDGSTSEKAFTVANCEQLQAIGGADGYYLNKYFRLAPTSGTDIDCSGIANFTPIGSISSPFSGVFDAAGYTISNLTINRPTEDQIGLFGAISGNPNTINNVHLRNINITGQYRVGGLMGYTSGQLVVTNSSVTGTVSGKYKVGGFAGSGSNISITNSSSSVAVSGTYTGATTERSIGGLLGAAYTSIITNSYNTGNVTANGTLYTGGLIGSGNDVRVIKSYNTGSVTGSATTHTVGGLIGSALWPTIENSYNSGSVTGMQRIGGLIGSAPTVNITNSYNSGLVTATYLIDSDHVGGDGAGGLVGVNSLEGLSGPFGDTGNSLTISNSFNVGTIIAPKNTGGLLGFATTTVGDGNYYRPAKTVSLSNNFYYRPTGSGLTCNGQLEIASGCDSKDTADYFKNTSSVAPFVGQWDFVGIDSADPIWRVWTNDYPKFTVQPVTTSHHSRLKIIAPPVITETITTTPVQDITTTTGTNLGTTTPVAPAIVLQTATTTSIPTPVVVIPVQKTYIEVFTHTLKLKDVEPDVIKLQKFLNENGFPLAMTGVGSKGKETNYFGTLTKNALTKFQEANAKDILVPVNLKKGTGVFEKMSRKFVNGLLNK